MRPDIYHLLTKANASVSYTQSATAATYEEKFTAFILSTLPANRLQNALRTMPHTLTRIAKLVNRNAIYKFNRF